MIEYCPFTSRIHAEKRFYSCKGETYCGDKEEEYICRLYNEKKERCILEDINNKLSSILDFQQSLIDLKGTIKSIDDWLSIMANLMKEK